MMPLRGSNHLVFAIQVVPNGGDYVPLGEKISK